MGITCKGKTRRGTPCKRPAGPSGFCYQHAPAPLGGDSPSKSSLTHKQQAFIAYYLCNGFNATQAAISAGYAESGAHTEGYRMLRNAEVQRELQQHFDTLAMQLPEVLGRLAEQARGSLAPFLRTTSDGAVVDLTTEEALAHLYLVKKAETKRRTLTAGDEFCEEITTKVELYDAQASLKILLTHLQPSVTRLEHSGVDGAPIEMAGGFTLDVSALSDDALAELHAALDDEG